MGLKGISWFEQNVDKLVVGIFGVALLGVVSWQFLGKGSTADLGTGKDKRTVTLDDAWSVVAAKAKETNASITSQEPDVSVLDSVKSSASSEGLGGRIQGPIAPKPKLAAALDRPAYAPVAGGPNVMPKSGSKAETYQAASIPAPSKPVGASYLGTIHPEEVRRNPELLGVFAPKLNEKTLTDNKMDVLLPKLDRGWISVESTFDGTMLQATLERDPDGDGPKSALPTHWWESIQILSVELERQEMKPDGSWTEAKAVAHMPGRKNLLNDVAESQKPGAEITFKSVMEFAGKNPDDIQRPPFYSLLFGEDWVAPSEVSEEVATVSVPGGDAVAGLKKNLAENEKDLRALKEQIDKLKEQGEKEKPKRPERNPTPPAPTSNPTGGGKTGGNQPGGDRPAATPTRDPNDQRIKGLETRYNNLFKKREKILEELRKRGVTEEGDKKPDAAAPVKPVATAAEQHFLLSNPSVRVWTHDIAVERGKTYRYRMAVVMNNPIYGRTAALTPEQAELAKQPTVRGEASEWSDPVSVEPETYFFITSATPDTGLSRGARASADVFVFSTGYWRRGTVNLEPGDAIAADVKVPDPVKIAAMLPAAAANPGGAATPVPGPRGRDGTVPRQPGPGGGDPAPVDPASLMAPRSVISDALLLDVASTTVVSDQGIAKTKTENQAFLLTGEGEIIVRTPEGDRAMALFNKLARSAEKGVDALKPKDANPVDLKPIEPTGGTPSPEPSGKGGGPTGGGGG